MTLVVLAGRPGTGKTTLSRLVAVRLGAALLRVDAVEAVVVDAVNPVPEARSGWWGLAAETGAGLVVVDLTTADAAEHRPTGCWRSAPLTQGTAEATRTRRPLDRRQRGDFATAGCGGVSTLAVGARNGTRRGSALQPGVAPRGGFSTANASVTSRLGFRNR